MKLFPHQQEVVDQLSNGKILCGEVGSGKSVAAIAYYIEKEAPKDVYVITTAKKRDSLEWERDAAAFGVGTSRLATVAGVITIDSWNNIQNYVDTEDAFFIFDEQRLVGTGEWVKAFQKIVKNNSWIMLTATPGDTWMDYVPVFIANGLYKNQTQFRFEHVVFAPYSRYPKIVRYLNVDLLEKYRNMILVDMEYVKHTVRHVEYVETEYDVDVFKQVMKKRWHVFENRPVKDVGELFRVMRKVAGTNPSRLDKIRELMEIHPRIIVFYNFNYELDILRTLAGEVDIGEWNGHRKQPIPDTERWVYLVQYVSGAEGWNCVSTDTMVFYSLTYSYKNLHQAMGRIDRLNTPFVDLYYYLLVSDSMIDRAVRKSLEAKKNFNERSFGENFEKFQDLAREFGGKYDQN